MATFAADSYYIRYDYVDSTYKPVEIIGVTNTGKTIMEGAIQNIDEKGNINGIKIKIQQQPDSNYTINNDYLDEFIRKNPIYSKTVNKIPSSSVGISNSSFSDGTPDGTPDGESRKGIVVEGIVAEGDSAFSPDRSIGQHSPMDTGATTELLELEKAALPFIQSQEEDKNQQIKTYTEQLTALLDDITISKERQDRIKKLLVDISNNIVT